MGKRTKKLGARERAKIEFKRLFYQDWLSRAIDHQMTPDLAERYWNIIRSISTWNKLQLEEAVRENRKRREKSFTQGGLDPRTGEFLLSRTGAGSHQITFWHGELSKSGHVTVESWIRDAAKDKTGVLNVPRAHVELVLPKVGVTYSRLWSEESKMEEHPPSIPFGAWLEIDFWGIDRSPDPTLRFATQHISLYEDMAYHFNNVLELSKQPSGNRTKKSIAACNRAVITFGLHCVEAYLNSIAFDYCVRKGARLSEDEKSLLVDEKRKGRNLSLRDKMLQYPKAITGKTSPPLQESNCPAMKIIDDAHKTIRHAIIHPKNRIESMVMSGSGPGPLGMEEEQPRMFYFYGQQEIVGVEKLADAVVDFVNEVEKLLCRNLEPQIVVPFLLVEREEEGPFPAEAFS